LAGLLYCGECAHKMMVRYSGATRYLCTFFHQQYGAPFCQNLPAEPVDAAVVEAFFEALSPVELDLYEKAMAAREKMKGEAEHAHQQQLQRLRYQAELARRRFERCDPDNRLVGAELERRWEGALRELRQAEESEAAEWYAKPHKDESIPAELTEELKAAFTAVGQKLPEIWYKDLLSQQQKKALVRCLIEKVIVRRIAPDLILTRIVWKGKETTTFEVPTTVGSFADLSGAEEMERLVVKLFKEGKSDTQRDCPTPDGDGPPLPAEEEARPAQHGSNHPPQARTALGREGEGQLARAQCPRLLNRLSGGAEARSTKPLGVRSHLQWDHPNYQRRQDETLSVP
jgi:Recombinase zinc beta ribbon domain